MKHTTKKIIGKFACISAVALLSSNLHLTPVYAEDGKITLIAPDNPISENVEKGLPENENAIKSDDPNTETKPETTTDQAEQKTEPKEDQTEEPSVKIEENKEAVDKELLSDAKESTEKAQKNNADEINKAIRQLSYDRDEILSAKGETIESKSFLPKEGIHGNGKFIVIERQKKSLTSSPVDISVIGSVIDRTYPGALQLANRSLVDNKPDLLLVDRSPINISISLPGLENENTVRVENPTYGNVNSAIDSLINKWSKKYGSTHTLPAQTQYNESMVYSKSQISTALNVNADLLEKSLGIDFKAIVDGEKNVMIASFKQIFYTVTAELPNKPSALFANNVTLADLTDAGMNDSNPPLIVSNVAYGRTIYVKLETSFKSKDVEAAFKALINKVDIKANVKYQDILKNSSFSAVVLGGDSKKHSEIITKDFDKIREIIKENSEFSLTNPGYPISYTGTFLKDNSIAVVNNLAEYVETTSTEYSKGRINLYHDGGYVAQFEILWDEVSFDNEGNEILTPKKWDKNWHDLTYKFNTTIPLPANARNIRILARECTGLAWEWWRIILNEKDVPLTSTINVSIGGTTLNPSASIEHKTDQNSK